MTRTELSVALVVLLTCSLSLKAFVSLRGASAEDATENADIVAYLQQAGLDVKPPMPATDPPWYVGTTDQCRVEMATVSPQGWHRAAVDWRAATLDGRSFYLQGGRTKPQQDVVSSTAAYYWRRLQRYLGLPSRDTVVRAVVVAGDCPDGVLGDERLAILSY